MQELPDSTIMLHKPQLLTYTVNEPCLTWPPDVHRPRSKPIIGHGEGFSAVPDSLNIQFPFLDSYGPQRYAKVYESVAAGVPLKVKTTLVAVRLLVTGLLNVKFPPVWLIVQYAGATQYAVGKVRVITGLAPGDPASVMVKAPPWESPAALPTVPDPHPPVNATLDAVRAVPVIDGEARNVDAELKSAVGAVTTFPPLSISVLPITR